MASPRLARLTRRAGLTVIAAVALAVGSLAATTQAANSAPGPHPNPYSPTVNHPYRHGAVPTRTVANQMNTYTRSHPAAPPASANNLNFGGGIDGIGVTTGREKVYLVFFGSQWGSIGSDGSGNTTLSGDPQSLAPYLQKLFKGLGTNNDLWSGVMTQYCEGVATGSQTCPSNAPHVGYPTGGNDLAGVWVDESTASPQQSDGHTLGTEAVTAAGHFGNTTAAANRNSQYVIVSPTGTTPDGFNAGGGFCAWHDYNGDSTLTGGAVSSPYGDVSFTNSPYVPDAGTSCGQNFVNSNGTLDGVSIVEGHEYAETITDQNPAGGWTDSSGAENGDKCAWIAPGQAGGAADLSLATGSFAMQATWGNDGAAGSGACQFTHSIIGGGGGGNTVTVTNPGNQTSTVGTPVSLQIHASDSATGQTLTYTATGLPNGLSISSSGLISGTPTTAQTTNTTVTATDTTGASGSTSFTWTVNPSGGGCSSPGNKISNGGFESGSTSWSSTPAVIGQNGPSEPAHSGTWDAWLDGYGTTHTDTLSQSVTIPSGCSGTLTFWLHIDTAETTTTIAYDTLTVKVGSTTLATYSNLNHNTGYAQKSFNVSSFAGQTVTLLFTGTEDASLQTSFVIDDVALNAS